MAMPHLKEARKEGIAEIERELGNDAQAKQFVPVARAVVNQMLNIAEGFMRDASAAGMSLHLNDQGLQTTLMAEFKPDTYGAKVASQFKNSREPLMAGLPEGREYFAAGGMINAPEVTGKVLADLLDPISKELAATPSGKSFVPAHRLDQEGGGGDEVVGVRLPGSDRRGRAGQRGPVDHGHARRRQDDRRLAEEHPPGRHRPDEDDAAGSGRADEVRGHARRQDGRRRQARHVQDEMAMDPNNPQAAQAQEIMSIIYGENGMTGVFGPVNNDAFVLVQGGTDETIQKAVNAASNPKDTMTGTAGIKTVSGQLPSQRILAEYIFLDNIVSTGVRYAQANGLPFKMKLPDNLPPIGMTAATEGNAVRFDAFVPTKLVQSLVAAGMESYMQMQGGGGPPATPGDGL